MAQTLEPVPLRVDPIRRLPQLTAGLALYGASNALMVRARLGLSPWDVFHQGVSQHTGIDFGTVTAATGLVVLLFWIPLRQRPGFGTVANILVVGASVDAVLAIVPTSNVLAIRITLLVSGVVLNGIATALYVGPRLGPGPRDGLMTGLSARTGLSIRLVRTGIEATVLLIGWLLGGNVGIGTVLYAVTIGPLVQFFLRFLVWESRDRVSG